MELPVRKTSLQLNPIKTRPLEDCRMSFSSHIAMPAAPDIPSHDVYYRESSVGVPFVWESRPGTPKVKYGEFTVRPLTPPPSFHSSPAIVRKQCKKSGNLILGLKKTPFLLRSPSRSPSTPSSMSSSQWSSPSSFHGSNESSKQLRIHFSSPPRMLLDSRVDQESNDFESPVSTLCFHRGRRRAHGRSMGCSAIIMKLFL